MLLAVLAFVSCKTQKDQAATPVSEAKAVSMGTPNSFGAAISKEGAVTYDDLLKKLTASDSLQIKVKGKVSEVCQAKGCWMTIVSTDESKPVMFVKFKDYGFFMPKDISGKEVIMDGMAYREYTSVDELRHYAQDAGKSEAEIKAIDKPVEELKFMASGVLLLQ